MSKKPSKLRLLSCQDSEDMAARCRRELDIPRSVAAKLGNSAVEAAIEGYYFNEAGGKVDWGQQVDKACAAACSISPDAKLPTPLQPPALETRVQVANETTLRASRRFIELGLKPVALNFANGIQPGGGFLNGARAQEEVLCRSSALHQTLVGDPMYAHHRARDQSDSTDWTIYSPDVPVFRTDEGIALDRPWLLSFLTCAAPYAPSVGQSKASALLRKRIGRVLAIARAYEYTSLVLGAWGCGAFANDPWRTALDFRRALETDFEGAFSDVVFAIGDWSPERSYLGPFREAFR